MRITDITRRRLVSQQIANPRLTTPGELVRWMGAVQAQDHLGSRWALGLRLRAAVESDVEEAVAARTIVRTWPMRGTLHYVPAADVRWMLRLLTPRVIARSAGRYRELELDPATFQGAAAALSSRASRRPTAALLPAWDEYVVAYKDRGAALDPPAARHDRVYAVGLALVAIDGRVRGSWRRSLASSTVRVSVAFWNAVTRDERRALEAAAERYGRFLGLSVEVVSDRRH